MKLRAHLAALLALSLGTACGPSSKASDTTPTGDNATQVGGGDNAVADDAMPMIPATPAEAPASLFAEVILANPNQQVTQMATFADAVQPGMGAFVTPQNLMQALEGMVQTQGLAGVDLNGPLGILVLDTENLALMVTVASEGELLASLTGTSQAVVHEGKALVGTPETLRVLAPYALSNFAKQAAPALPSLNFYVARFMAGPVGQKSMQDTLANMAGDERMGAEWAYKIFNELEVLRVSFEGDPKAAILRMVGESREGHLRSFLAQQKPSDYSELRRLGAGPWSMVAGGRLDLTAFAPMVDTFIEHVGGEAPPFVSPLFKTALGMNGEMGLALSMGKSREVVFTAKLPNAEALKGLLEPIFTLIAAEKDLELEGMKGTFKKNSLNTKGGKLAELKFKPMTKELQDVYGKTVSGFFGVAGGNLIAAFGGSAKQQAKLLGDGKGLTGKGSALEAAVAESAAAGESLFFAMDPLSLSGDREAADKEPVVFGLGFSGTTLSGRLVFPVSFVREAAQQAGGF